MLGPILTVKSFVPLIKKWEGGGMIIISSAERFPSD